MYTATEASRGMPRFVLARNAREVFRQRPFGDAATGRGRAPAMLSALPFDWSVLHEWVSVWDHVTNMMNNKQYLHSRLRVERWPILARNHVNVG